MLAKRFGVHVSMFYKLGYGEQKELTMNEMLADLRRTLPVVVSRVSRDGRLADPFESVAREWLEFRSGRFLISMRPSIQTNLCD